VSADRIFGLFLITAGNYVAEFCLIDCYLMFLSVCGCGFLSGAE
jgi:hypothetical protein